ncbi:hypothetical protein B0H10DRAFT_1954551 [Mycena sp. CBHHK59/15]|nr:hypothetical protein B0H10DRAFT_1954551 [Mycena sp. CBHHK59/15]
MDPSKTGTDQSPTLRFDNVPSITALECVDGDVDAEVYEMLLAGHDVNEPYLTHLLRHFQNTSCEALQRKLNIPSRYIPVSTWWCAQIEGEVYINFPAKGGPQVGLVAAMRNPAMIPMSFMPQVLTGSWTGWEAAASAKKPITRSKTIKIAGCPQNISCPAAWRNMDMSMDAIKRNLHYTRTFPKVAIIAKHFPSNSPWIAKNILVDVQHYLLKASEW